MKQIVIYLILTTFLVSGVAFGEPPKKKRKVIVPDECRTAGYTCVMKISDGVAYFCQKTVTQREKNAKKEYRAVVTRKCRKKLPVFYMDSFDKKSE
ncbi:MAG: hypothetical protein OEY59_03595 [Deltaproteobacteria bacterium]|nr:hypothetical protein [Deltaproteobacteria bacterium]